VPLSVITTVIYGDNLHAISRNNYRVDGKLQIFRDVILT